MPGHGPRDEVEARERAAFQLSLRQRGIRDNNVLRALETVPRTLFVPDGLEEHAYADRALPIASVIITTAGSPSGTASV